LCLMVKTTALIAPWGMDVKGQDGIKTHPKFVQMIIQGHGSAWLFFWMILRTSGFSGGSRLWAWLCQVTYTLIVAIMVMNLVIAVILESYEDPGPHGGNGPLGVCIIGEMWRG